MLFFKDRADAGKQLAQALVKYQGQEIIVFALPRGGVPVAQEIANFLHAPLDLILAHKIGHPYQPEYAIGAISEDGHIIGNMDELRDQGEQWLDAEKQRQIAEIKRKREIYLKDRKPVSLENKIAIIVDDGIATGLTMQVGILELKDRHPKKIVVAVPVAPIATAERLRAMADDFVAVEIAPEHLFLGAVGAYYNSFDQVEDAAVVAILASHSNNK